MKLIKIYTCLSITLFLFTAFQFDSTYWGFFVHRRINRLAVFTLPTDLIPFYKKHIEYVTSHATDPDMRRYVIPIEGPKHFIDLDTWKEEELPRKFTAVRKKFVNLQVINSSRDTLSLFGNNLYQLDDWNVVLKGDHLSTFLGRDSILLLKEDFDSFFNKHIYHPQYVKEWELNCDSIQIFFLDHGFELDCSKVYAIDSFVEHGVLPYNLIRMQYALRDAMIEKNLQKILRASADIGHYIGDAHVPLHTTSNYNGQKTNQLGIHAFWETRLPELFADEDYDYFVGQATYISNIEDHYWSIVEKSHSLVEEVLTIEKQLSLSFPEDQQDCFVERGAGYLQKMPCEAYATLYHEALNGQVESRLREAIKSVGDAWYTAWVDAGEPDLYKIFEENNLKEDLKEKEALEKAVQTKPIIGREHKY